MRKIEEVMSGKVGGEFKDEWFIVGRTELEAWQADCQRLKEKVGELQAELSEWNFADAITAGEFTKAKTTRLPEIICLCGSTKFVSEFDKQMLRLTLEGNIILSIGTHRETDENLARKYADGFEGKKAMLDELHKRKIDLADRVFVVNVGGYVGDSTKSEIEYALKAQKPIAWLEPDKAWRNHEREKL